MKRLHFVLFCSFGILGLLSFLLVFGSFLGTSKRKSRVFEYCPEMNPSGLKSEELPLGNTERLTDRTEEILQFDDYVYREYRIGGNSLSVYIAYWGLCDSNLKQTTGHNPDQCWVKFGGWKEHRRCEQASLELGVRSKQLDYSNSELHLAGSSEPSAQRSISPVEYRYLEAPDGSESYHVYFWQTWGGVVVPIRNKDELSLLSRMNRPDYWRIWEPKRKPLYFIRIHSKTPLAPVVETTGMANSEGIMANEEDSIVKEKSSAIRHLPSAIDNDQHYLIDYPEVRELLLSIHRLTTGESEALGVGR